jgi:hypothetical protein
MVCEIRALQTQDQGFCNEPNVESAIYLKVVDQPNSKDMSKLSDIVKEIYIYDKYISTIM